MCVSVCTSVCTRGISATLLCSFGWVSCRSQFHGSSASCQKTKSPNQKTPEVETALLKPVSYGLLCKNKHCTEHLEAPKLPNSALTKEIWLSFYGREGHWLVCLLVCSIYKHSYGAYPQSICMPAGVRSGFLGEVASLFSSSTLEISAKEGINPPPGACATPVRDWSLHPS